MANILDLLMDYRNVTAKNNDISMLYICYQVYTEICYTPDMFVNSSRINYIKDIKEAVIDRSVSHVG